MRDELEEFLDYIPETIPAWEKHPETGFVVLKKPKFKNKYLVKYLLPYLKRPDFRINLDKIGSFVWMQIDGKTTLREIAARMQAEFGKEVDPVYERLAQYIQSLFTNKFINFSNV